MSRRKRIHGHKRTHRSPLPKITGNRVLDVSSGADPTKAADFVQGKLQKDITKKAVTRTLGAVAGRVAGGIGIAATLYDMYKEGQETSGGRVGYTKISSKNISHYTNKSSAIEYWIALEPESTYTV